MCRPLKPTGMKTANQHLKTIRTRRLKVKCKFSQDEEGKTCNQKRPHNVEWKFSPNEDGTDRPSETRTHSDLWLRDKTVENEVSDSSNYKCPM